jgi:hypothetical protein
MESFSLLPDGGPLRGMWELRFWLSRGSKEGPCVVVYSSVVAVLEPRAGGQAPFLGDPPRNLVHAHGLRPHRHATQTLARRVLGGPFVKQLHHSADYHVP